MGGVIDDSTIHAYFFLLLRYACPGVLQLIVAVMRWYYAENLLSAFSVLLRFVTITPNSCIKSNLSPYDKATIPFYELEVGNYGVSCIQFR